MSGTDPRRLLPSVDGLLNEDRVAGWSERWGRSHVKRVVREVLEDQRRLVDSSDSGAAETEPILRAVLRRLEAADQPVLRPLLNGTGVVLHTNLGRAPLPQEALAAIDRVASGYSNLEYELTAGTRGSRHSHCAHVLRELTGSEAAIVVNNNAAAVALVVNEFALGRQVVVSRGELVEIGGSFRIPDIVTRSGAELVEVGTTNRTRIQDYRQALGPDTGLILKVHPSNYRITGFVAEVELTELVDLGREFGVPVANDLGSGLLLGQPAELLSRSESQISDEPLPTEAVAAGADPITWSGDKLLGGPQAGIIHGSARTVERLRANALLRALRVDKLTLAALEATLRLYRKPGCSGDRDPGAPNASRAEDVRTPARNRRALAPHGAAPDTNRGVRPDIRRRRRGAAGIEARVGGLGRARHARGNACTRLPGARSAAGRAYRRWSVLHRFPHDPSRAGDVRVQCAAARAPAIGGHSGIFGRNDEY